MKIIFFLIVIIFPFCMQAQGLSKKQLSEVENIMAPLRLKVEASLKDQDAKMYKKYITESKNLALNADRQSKFKLFQFRARYSKFINSGYAKAHIDEAATIKQLDVIFKASGYKIKYSQYLGITGFAVWNQTSPTPTNGCIELKCPMDVINTTMSQNNAALGDPFNFECEVDALSMTLIAGAQENVSASGKTTAIQKDIVRVDVSCPLNYLISGSAFSFLGGGYAEASLGFKIKGPNIDKRIEFFPPVWVIAPVVWYSSFEQEGINNLMETSFVPSVQGGNYTIQVFVKSYAMAAVGSNTSSLAIATDFDPITVCQIKK